MKVALELTDMAGKVLLRPALPSVASPAMPSIGDVVSIESKQWEVAKRHFHYHANGTLHKVTVQCRENEI